MCFSKLERQSYKLGNRTRSATLEAKERTKVHTKESTKESSKLHTKESTKLRSLCLGWNLTGSCSKETAGDCPHVHRCSYMIIGEMTILTIVKLREREGQRVDLGRSLKGHLWMVDGGWWYTFP